MKLHPGDKFAVSVAAKDALVDINSNVMATVKATEKLDYSAVGNAGLTYTGGAKLGEQKTGGNR